FFFQAEDGIRDYKVTGVQTCALPIYAAGSLKRRHQVGGVNPADVLKAEIDRHGFAEVDDAIPRAAALGHERYSRICNHPRIGARSEERRVGKECRYGRSR